MDETSELYVKGLQVRREVLGDEYVDNSLRDAGDGPGGTFQDYVTMYCWGAVWARPGLDRRTRSLINIGMLTALNRPRELHLHVHGALRNGCTQEEVEEVVLQTAPYCGIPAALDAVRVVRAVTGSAGQDNGGRSRE
jgi:4-carboxymuconolactone decarboxylase